MSIKSNIVNTFPMPLIGMAGALTVQTVEPRQEEDTYDVCVCQQCNYTEYAFVLNGGALHQNDWKRFIEKKIFSSDMIDFILFKDGVQVAVLNASTYGTLYDYGDLLFVNFPTYKGFHLDWNLVQQGFGYGDYTVKIVIVSLGVAYTKESHVFRVMGYSQDAANGTVKIETMQNGNLEKHWDFTGLEWPQMTRLKAFFGWKTPALILNNYEDFGKTEHEIQSKIEYTYTLETKQLEAEIFNYLNENGLRGNTIHITDYNIPNQELYRRRSVYLTNFKDVEHQMLTNKANFKYEFKDKRNNDIKRNSVGDGGGFFTGFGTGGGGAVGGNVCYISARFNIGDDIADIGENVSGTIQITVKESGTYTSVSDDGGSGTITFNHNLAGYVAFASPMVLAVGDTLAIKRTTKTGYGWVLMTGTF